MKELIESGIDIKTLFERHEQKEKVAAIPNMRAVRKAIKAVELQNKLLDLSEYKQSAEDKLT